MTDIVISYFSVNVSDISWCFLNFRTLYAVKLRPQV